MTGPDPHYFNGFYTVTYGYVDWPSRSLWYVPILFWWEDCE